MADPAASLVGLGQLQLQIKAGSSNNYDTQALGLLAVLVAVATALVVTLERVDDLLRRKRLTLTLAMLFVGVSAVAAVVVFAT